LNFGSEIQLNVYAIIIFSVHVTGPNQRKSGGFLKSPLKKAIEPTKNPTLYFSFENCPMK